MRITMNRKGGVLAAVFVLALTLSALLAGAAFAARSTPAAGTQGRGGVALALSAPAAGTAGRGGIAVADAG